MSARPFGMLSPDTISNSQRGYKSSSLNFKYNPATQTSNIASMGPTLTLSSLDERDSDTTSDSED